MDGTTLLIIVVIVGVVFYAIGASTNDDGKGRESSSPEELGNRAHSANLIQDRDRDHGGMDDGGGSE